MKWVVAVGLVHWSWVLWFYLARMLFKGLLTVSGLVLGRRSRLAQEIYATAAAAETGWASAEEVDNIGLAGALRLATRRAVAA